MKLILEVIQEMSIRNATRAFTRGLGVLLFAIFILAITVNSCVRVGERGVLEYWLEGSPPVMPMSRWTEDERNGYYALESALDAYSKGGRVLEQLAKEGKTMATADIGATLPEFRNALVSAAQVPASTLDRMHPQMREKFREEFQHGLQMMLDGMEKKDNDLAARGADHCDNFRLWIQNHAREIEANKNR